MKSNHKTDFFKGRNIVIATQHHKERVIAPLLEKALGVKCYVPENLNTDLLGTFTGEIERLDDPLSTVRKKCHMAMALSGCDLALANEGSFGMHPSLLFAPADDEIVMLIDNKNDVEIIARVLSTETNFNKKEVKSKKELFEFANAVHFPSHGIIFRKSEFDNQDITKGVNSYEQLEKTFGYYLHRYGSAFLETDMRALYNPTRLKIIEAATLKLINKINNTCPHCNTPGFDIGSIKSGLPCKLCLTPTRSTLSHVYICRKCQYQEEVMYPNKQEYQDPTYCDFCNP